MEQETEVLDISWLLLINVVNMDEETIKKLKQSNKKSFCN